MRVLWLSHFLPYPPTGLGACQRSFHLLREAAKRHEIHLVALHPYTTSTAPQDVSRAVGALRAFLASVDVFPLADRHGTRRALRAAVSFAQRSSYWEKWLWSRAMYAQLRCMAERLHFDLVHLDAVFLARYLGAVPEVPVALNHHNIESHLLRRRANSERTAWLRLFYGREARKVESLEREVATRVAQNLVVSDLDGMRLRQLALGARTTTVANGVDVRFFQTTGTPTEEPCTMIFAGRMDWLPNRDAVLFFISEIWPALLKDNPARRMTIVGKDPPIEVLAAASDARLRVTGFIDDVRPCIEAASVYVCPLRVGGGTRLKILDALAMSRPVVSTDVGVEGLGLVHEQHYLRANSVTEFVSQIGRLETDRHLRERLGRAGREIVERRYAWDLVAQSLDRAYDEAVGVRSAPG